MAELTATATLKPKLNATARIRDKVDTTITFIYPLGSELVYTTTIVSEEEGDYTTQTLTNIATVEYKVNDVVKILPFSLVVGNVLKITITKTSELLESRVQIAGNRIQ